MVKHVCDQCGKDIKVSKNEIPNISLHNTVYEFCSKECYEAFCKEHEAEMREEDLNKIRSKASMAYGQTEYLTKRLGELEKKVAKLEKMINRNLTIEEFKDRQIDPQELDAVSGDTGYIDPTITAEWANGFAERLKKMIENETGIETEVITIM